MSVRLTTPDDYKSLLDNHDTWLFDCDGVLWHDDEVIDGVIEVLGILRCQGEHCYNSRLLCIEQSRQKDHLRHKQRYKIPKDLQG
jgi:4-nitrophenyl phosphatase